MYLDLDNAWFDPPPGMPRLHARDWGPPLRFSAPPRLIEKFFHEYDSRLKPFNLYGSGDFHHLSALWIRRVAESVDVVSFDNHPDWDIRPPKWCCGGWINRALELPNVRHVSVWGCGNFEYWWPRNLFGNRRAVREGRLDIHPWADGRSARDRERDDAILRENWRERFEMLVNERREQNVYVTIDLDCLRAEDAVTNWESGRFSVVDLEWALAKLRTSCRIVAGDICGAYSPPQYARFKQRFAAEFDHPNLRLPAEDQIRKINSTVIAKLWPALAQ
jgi:hypothetical protein